MRIMDPYRKDERKMQQLIDVTKAVLARIPKKYAEPLLAMLKHFPDA